MQILREIKKWYKIPDDPEGTELYIRLLSAGEIAEIASKTQRTLFADGRPSVEIDHALDGMLTAEKALVGWRNLLDDGMPVEYSRKNLRKVLAEVPGLAVQIAEFHRQLAGESGKIEEDVEKD